jgi:hypothetical protein
VGRERGERPHLQQHQERIPLGDLPRCLAGGIGHMVGGSTPKKKLHHRRILLLDRHKEWRIRALIPRLKVSAPLDQQHNHLHPTHNHRGMQGRIAPSRARPRIRPPRQQQLPHRNMPVVRGADKRRGTIPRNPPHANGIVPPVPHRLAQVPRPPDNSWAGRLSLAWRHILFTRVDRHVEVEQELDPLREALLRRGDEDGPAVLVDLLLRPGDAPGQQDEGRGAGGVGASQREGALAVLIARFRVGPAGE